MQKVLWVLQSRKFWASLIGLLAALGILEASELQEAELAQALVTVCTALGYAFTVALEDSARHLARRP